jgi:hypothetical protein
MKDKEKKFVVRKKGTTIHVSTKVIGHQKNKQKKCPSPTHLAGTGRVLAAYVFPFLVLLASDKANPD